MDAVKRNCIKVLPHTLVVHLKRFEFDYETMNRWKIKDRFAFPLHLDMHPYTVEGLAEADAAASGKVCTNQSPCRCDPQHVRLQMAHVIVQLRVDVAHSAYECISGTAVSVRP